MEKKKKKSGIRFYHVFFAVIGAALIWLCICYARRGVFYLDYEFLYKWGNKYAGKNKEIQMEQKKDAYYFTIKDKKNGEKEEAVLRWMGDASDEYKEYEITFGENHVIMGTWTQGLERDFYMSSGCFGGTEMRENVSGNQCRALCRIAAKKYEHLGNIWNGLLGLCLYIIGTMCCIPYKGTVMVKSDMPKIKPNKTMRFFIMLVGIGLILYGIDMTCRDWATVTTDRIWYEMEKSTHC